MFQPTVYLQYSVFGKLVSVVLFLFPCIEFLAFMQYDVYVVPHSGRSVRVLFDQEMHDETVNNPQFPCFSGSSVVLVHSDTVIRASTSDQIGSLYTSFSVFFYSVKSAVLHGPVQCCGCWCWASQEKCKAGLLSHLVLQCDIRAMLNEQSFFTI